MNRIKKFQVFVADETGGETAEWAGVVALIIAMGVAVYNGGLQVAIQSSVSSIIATIASIVP